MLVNKAMIGFEKKAKEVITILNKPMFTRFKGLVCCESGIFFIINLAYL
jgi:hypothetical protein